MADTFCALPFRHLCIGPEGTARICCMTSELVSEHGAPMSLSQHTMDGIWNSAYMRNIRRAMLKGERISACEVCYASEAATGQSYRTSTGLQPYDGPPETVATMRKYGAAAGFRVEERPGFIKLEVSNLCNLKCRMCYGAASSQIERDPVHSRWSGGVEPMHAVWRGERARIGPEPRIGVRTSGLEAHDVADGGYRRWTDGHATFSVQLEPDADITALEIRFHVSSARGQEYRIIVNGRPMLRGVLTAASAEARVDLHDTDLDGTLVLEIISNTVVDALDKSQRGLALRDIELLRTMADRDHAHRPMLLSSRLAVDGPWYTDEQMVSGDILKPDGSLKRLYITGGEPLLNASVASLLAQLVQSGAARQIHLQLSSNCTRIDSHIIEIIRQFRRLELLVSLDAVGPAYEYIRYPARWASVAANVRRLQAAGITCWVTPVVHTYNILELVELYRHCDHEGLEVFLNILAQPRWLAISNLPPSLRAVAAARLRDYHDKNCREINRPAVLQLSRYLEHLSAPADHEALREFMLFTNDLDYSRRQSFKAIHADFVALAAKDGFIWSDETRFAGEDHTTIPARQRAYAWL